jgi:hypothetical protein
MAGEAGVARIVWLGERHSTLQPTRTPHNFHHKNSSLKSRALTDVPSISKGAERLNATWLWRKEPNSNPAWQRGSATDSCQRFAPLPSPCKHVSFDVECSPGRQGTRVLEQLRDSPTLGLVSDPVAAFPCLSTSSRETRAVSSNPALRMKTLKTI